MNEQHPAIEQVVAETSQQIGDSNGPYVTYSIQRTIVAYTWNPGYNESSLCECGHHYRRHFDSHEEMPPVGCKYCECRVFRQKG